MVDIKKKRQILALLLLAFLVTFVVSTSLSELQLQRGLPFPSGQGAEDNSGIEATPAPIEPLRWTANPKTLAILPFLFVMGLFYLVFKQPEMRRVLLWILLLGLFIGLLTMAFGNEQTTSDRLIPFQDAPEETYQVGPIGEAPPAFLWIAAGGLVLLALGAGFWLVRAADRAPSIKDLIQAEAENALKEIRDGSEWKNVIIRCYLQMVFILQEKQGIERTDAMTTREFERLLVSHRFPEGEVHRLTALFEKVRYGNKPVDRADEQTAVECLKAITGNLGD